MHHALKTLIAAMLITTLAACGGGSEDEDSGSNSAALLNGDWYSSQTMAKWSFSSSGAGLLMQGSTDGTACRLTWIDFSVNTSSATITYYITRARGLGPNNTYDSGNVHEGPYSASYSISGNSATIGAGTYSKTSTGMRPAGCENA